MINNSRWISLSEEALSLGSTALTIIARAGSWEACVVWLQGLLEELEDILDQLESIRAVKKTGLTGKAIILLLGEEVGLILVLNLLPFADLWKFIPSHIEELSVEFLVVEVGSCFSRRLWLFVADKCYYSVRSAVLAVLVPTLNDLDALDFTAFSEKLKQLLLVVGGGEVFDEKVALLLGVLESLLLTVDSCLSL